MTDRTWCVLWSVWFHLKVCLLVRERKKPLDNGVNRRSEVFPIVRRWRSLLALHLCVGNHSYVIVKGRTFALLLAHFLVIVHNVKTARLHKKKCFHLWHIPSKMQKLPFIILHYTSNKKKIDSFATFKMNLIEGFYDKWQNTRLSWNMEDVQSIFVGKSPIFIYLCHMTFARDKGRM